MKNNHNLRMNSLCELVESTMGGMSEARANEYFNLHVAPFALFCIIPGGQSET